MRAIGVVDPDLGPPPEGGAGSSAADVLVLGLGQKPISVTGLLRQPACIGLGIGKAHANHGMFLVLRKAWVPPRDARLVVATSPDEVVVGLFHEPGKLADGDIVLPHIEALGEPHQVHGAFVVVAPIFVNRRAHSELT